MGVGSGERGCTPWIFIHDTDFVDRDLIVLFFGLFFVAHLPPGRGLIVLFFVFLLFFVFFLFFFRCPLSPPPPGNFSAYALDHITTALV